MCSSDLNCKSTVALPKKILINRPPNTPRAPNATVYRIIIIYYKNFCNTQNKTKISFAQIPFPIFLRKRRKITIPKIDENYEKPAEKIRRVLPCFLEKIKRVILRANHRRRSRPRRRGNRRRLCRRLLSCLWS